MRALCLLASVGVTQVAALNGVTRTFYIAADEVIWDYAPTGMNQIIESPSARREPVGKKWTSPNRKGVQEVYLSRIHG